MPPRKKAPVDPLHSVKTEVCASLGETWLKVECPLHMASDVALRLHEVLERVVKERPQLGHVVADLHGGVVYAPDGEYYEEGKAPKKPPLGFGQQRVQT